MFFLSVHPAGKIYSAPKTTQLILKNKVFIEAEYVTLFDIVKKKDDLENVKLFATPESPMYIQTDELSSLLHDTHLDLPIAGKDCLIIPLNKPFTAGEITESLYTEIVKRNSLEEGQFRFTYSDASSILLPGKDVEYRWGSFSKNLQPGKIIFPLDVYWEGKKIFSKKISVLVEKKHIAAVSTKYLPIGTILSQESYVIKEIYSTDQKTDYLTDDIEGLTALANIPENTILRFKLVKKFYTVEKGSIIWAVYEKGNIKISSKARAEEFGNKGDTIRVRFLNTQKITSGIVFNKDIVLIQ
jgi:flagella basal body P-ring formation protein FlgA